MRSKDVSDVSEKEDYRSTDHENKGKLVFGKVSLQPA